MPVIGIPLDEFFAYYGEPLASQELEDELHRFGCSVEGWETLVRYRCPCCSSLLESGEGDLPPAACESCGADLRAAGNEPALEGKVDVLKMELLAVRPDLFHPAGLARAMRGFLGKQSGAPVYRVEPGPWTVDVDPALAGPEVFRPRIVFAAVRNLRFDDASLRSLMKLQENLHWALGRDRKLASIGVYDLAAVKGPGFFYRAVLPDELRFVPLGYDPADPAAAVTPAQILAEHPKGKAFARLLEGAGRMPLLSDAEGGVLSLPPIINSEATRVTRETTDVVIDVTGLEDRHVDRALNIVVTSLLESCPEAYVETAEIRYGRQSRSTPALEPQKVLLDPAEAGDLIGQQWSRAQVIELLERMRHGAAPEGARVAVAVPAWRADILHPRDLIEDVAIAHGYDALPAVALSGATFADPHPRELAMAKARETLVGLGAMEVMTLALSSESATYGKTGLIDRGEHVKLQHPISVEQTMLRVSLIPGLMETLTVNLGHSYPQRICEVGSVCLVDSGAETGASERLRAALALAGDGIGYADIRGLAGAFLREWGVRLDGGGMKLVPSEEPLFLPGRGAELLQGGWLLGRFGEIHPAVLEGYRIIHPVVAGEFDLERLALA